MRVVAFTTANATVWVGNTATVTQVPSTVPSAPRSLQALAPTATSMQVSWQVPASNGGSPLTEPSVGDPLYTVEITSADPSAGTIPSCTFANPADRFCAVTAGLVDGVLYDITVKAHNRMGFGPVATTQFIPSASDATLRDLVVETGDPATGPGTPVLLDPVFASSTVRYTAEVGNGVTEVAVTPTVNSPGASVSVDGIGVVSGEPSQPLPLTVGVNTVLVKIIASNPVFSQTYTIVITRAALPPSPGDGGGLAPIPVLPEPVSKVTESTTALVMLDGAPVTDVTVTRNDTDSGWNVVSSDFGMTLAAVSVNGRTVEMRTIGVMRVPQGGAVELAANGYLPGSPVSVFAIPTGTTRALGAASRTAVELGLFNATSLGEFSERVVVPQSVAIGGYILQVNGFTAGLEQQRSVNVRMDVVAGSVSREGVVQEAGFFKARSAVLSRNGLVRLQAMIDAVPADAKDVVIDIVGVSVSMATTAENMRLAFERGKQIAEYLVDAGVDGDYSVTTKFSIDSRDSRTNSKVARVLELGETNVGNAGAGHIVSSTGHPLTTTTIAFTTTHTL